MKKSKKEASKKRAVRGLGLEHLNADERWIVEQDGKPRELPKKIKAGAKESYHPLGRK